MFDHINKVKSLANQLTCLEVPMKEEHVVMTLFNSLPSLFDHLITTLDFITACLMHKVSKRKANKPLENDVGMVLR